MNLTKHILASLLIASMAFTACDDIDEADRWQPTAEVSAKKNVLIEDFTGQKCINCPKAHDVMADIQEKLGHSHIIAVSIHGGSLSLTDNGQNTLFLANDESNALTTQWGVTSWPMGLVDRTGSLTAPADWTKQAVERCQLEAKANIQLSDLAFDATTRTLTLNANVTALAALNGTLHLWLTESGIKTLQYFPGNKIDPQYVHNHVYRAALNTPEGTPIVLTTGASHTLPASYTLARTYWQAENLSIVAFVETPSDGVVQVIEEKLLP